MRPASVAVVGGTGAQGSGLAWRLAVAGVPIAIGSRDAGRAAATAEEIARRVPGSSVSGATNAAACEACEVAIIAVPYAGLQGTVGPLADATAGKVVISCVNALVFDRLGPAPIAVPAGSAAAEVAALLPLARVTAGFTSVSAVHLGADGSGLDEDVLVVGDDQDAVAVAVALADAIPGLRGVSAGPLRLAGTVEALTAVILVVNRINKANVGLRLSGLG